MKPLIYIISKEINRLIRYWLNVKNTDITFIFPIVNQILKSCNKTTIFGTRLLLIIPPWFSEYMKLHNIDITKISENPLTTFFNETELFLLLMSIYKMLNNKN